MRICDLREKEVINICDGERLGFVEDVEFDLCTGKITHIIAPANFLVCWVEKKNTSLKYAISVKSEQI